MTDITYTLDGTEETWRKFQQTAQSLPPDSTYEVVFRLKVVETGKWGMARLWRAWMRSTGDWMAGRGAKQPLLIKSDGTHHGERAFNEHDAHELFTHQWLGCDAGGMRLSWSKSGREGMRPADKGQRFIAMLRHEEWALERGIMLFKPRDSEFAELEREQNGQ